MDNTSSYFHYITSGVFTVAFGIFSWFCKNILGRIEKQENKTSEHAERLVKVEASSEEMLRYREDMKDTLKEMNHKLDRILEKS